MQWSMQHQGDDKGTVQTLFCVEEDEGLAYSSFYVLLSLENTNFPCKMSFLTALKNCTIV